MALILVYYFVFVVSALVAGLIVLKVFYFLFCLVMDKIRLVVGEACYLAK